MSGYCSIIRAQAPPLLSPTQLLLRAGYSTRTRLYQVLIITSRKTLPSVIFVLEFLNIFVEFEFPLTLNRFASKIEPFFLQEE
jgi:hypothetical protein